MGKRRRTGGACAVAPAAAPAATPAASKSSKKSGRPNALAAAAKSASGRTPGIASLFGQPRDAQWRRWGREQGPREIEVDARQDGGRFAWLGES